VYVGKKENRRIFCICGRAKSEAILQQSPVRFKTRFFIISAAEIFKWKLRRRPARRMRDYFVRLKVFKQFNDSQIFYTLTVEMTWGKTDYTQL
jgi:hypothetical protein